MNAQPQTVTKPSLQLWAVYIAIFPLLFIAIRPGPLPVILQLIALCIVLFIRFRDKAKKGSIVPFVLGLIALAAATWAWHIGA